MRVCKWIILLVGLSVSGQAQPLRVFHPVKSVTPKRVQRLPARPYYKETAALHKPAYPAWIRVALPGGPGTSQPSRFAPANAATLGLWQKRLPLRLLPQRGAHPANPFIFPGKETIDGVIFDLDGTLLNSLSAWEHSGSNFLRTQGIEPPPQLDEELKKLSLMDGARLLKQRYQLPYTEAEILERTLRPIREHYYHDIKPMPGIPELLANLHAQGIKMAVATASDRELALVSLYRLGLLSYFEFVITCDEVQVGKGSPLIYEEALARLGTTKARTLVVEDALHALQTAHLAGFPTAAMEESHSAAQRAQKVQVADYYIWTRPLDVLP